MRPSFTPLLACALAALLAPTGASGQDVSAQQPPDKPLPEQVRRPFRGLFGAPADPTASKQSLDLKVSAFGAYDDDLLGADSGGSTVGAYQQRGTYGGATAGLAYSRPGERVSIGLDADVAANRYPSLDETSTMYRTGGSMGFQVARRTRVSLGGDFVYAPQYRLGLFANPASVTGEADPFATVATDFDLFRNKAYRTSGQVGVSQTLGRRASLDGFVGLDQVNYAVDRFDYRGYSAGLRFSRRLTQNFGVHAGYSYVTAGYSNLGDARRPIQNIDVGVDYDRALSFSRRTTLSFSTGTGVLASPDRRIAGAPERGLTYRVIGSAMLHHELGRTWTGGLGYRRSIDFREGFNEPFLSDSVTGTFGGFLSRRLRFSSNADYAFGSVGTGVGDRRYESASAGAGLEYAISRRAALYGRYIFYRYHFGAEVVVDPRLVPTLDRQGVRIGVKTSFPLLRSMRKS